MLSPIALKPKVWGKIDAWLSFKGREFGGNWGPNSLGRAPKGPTPSAPCSQWQEETQDHEDFVQKAYSELRDEAPVRLAMELCFLPTNDHLISKVSDACL